MSAEILGTSGPDPSILAKLVTKGGSPEERDRAMAALVPIIRSVARRVARQFSGQGARELIEESPSIICEKLLEKPFDASKGRFESWCMLVLRNTSIDNFRKARRYRRFSDGLGENPAAGMEGLVHGSGDPGPARDATLDHAAPFSSGDLGHIESWEPTRDRLLLLCFYGLWPKVPVDLWSQWTSELHLEPPFPPDSFLHLESKRERNMVLAETLGLPRNTLSQVISRKRTLVQGLDYVKGLQP